DQLHEGGAHSRPALPIGQPTHVAQPLPDLVGEKIGGLKAEELALVFLEEVREPASSEDEGILSHQLVSRLDLAVNLVALVENDEDLLQWGIFAIPGELVEQAHKAQLVAERVLVPELLADVRRDDRVILIGRD